MKKYQLKINEDNKLKVIKESDIFFDILFFINKGLITTISGLKTISVWMNGQVLD